MNNKIWLLGLLLMVVCLPVAYAATGNLNILSTASTPANLSYYIGVNVVFSAIVNDSANPISSAVIKIDGTNYTMDNTTTNATNTTGVGYAYTKYLTEGYHTYQVFANSTGNATQTAVYGYTLYHPYTQTYLSSDLGTIAIDAIGWVLTNFVTYASLLALAVLVLLGIALYEKG